MTTTTVQINPYPDIAPPAGAVWVDEWFGEGKDRGRSFQHAPYDMGEAVLTIRGVQYADGRTGRSILIRLEEELQAQGDDLTSMYARRLAAMLHNFADTCDFLDEIAR